MRIVLDLGTSYTWRRPAVGIVRTERKFAEYLLSRPDLDVAFCRLDQKEWVHVAIPFEEVRELLRETREPAAPPPPTTRDHAMNAARRVGRILPKPLRRQAKMLVRAGRSFTKDAVRLAVDRLQPRRGSLPGTDPTGFPDGSPDPELFRFHRNDVYFSMGQDWVQNSIEEVGRARRAIGFEAVLFCYDTIPVNYPHLTMHDFQEEFKSYLVDVAQAASRVVAISQATKDDFFALLDDAGVHRPPVDVVHLGTDLSVDGAGDDPMAADLRGRPYVLCVGTIEARKNHEVLYHAWDRLAAKHGDRMPQLVVVGLPGWGVTDLLYRIRMNPRTRNRIQIFENVTDGELTWLYRNALFTVFPSFYEGWGLPVVESLALGTPCIASNTPAVVEASQGMAIAIDPLDVPAWVAAIERLWLEGSAREEIASRLQRDYHAQTWQDFGESLVRIATELA